MQERSGVSADKVLCVNCRYLSGCDDINAGLDAGIAFVAVTRCGHPLIFKGDVSTP